MSEPTGRTIAGHGLGERPHAEVFQAFSRAYETPVDEMVQIDLGRDSILAVWREGAR
jgi:hypothetical protein